MNTAQQLKLEGMDRAIKSAHRKDPDWFAKAVQFLAYYAAVNHKKPFMVEDVRNAAKGHLPEPPSKRAWGPVVIEAAKNKIVKRFGYGPTTNPSSHGTPASLWIKA